eukprot:6923584-Prymnesium_polylepis.2
MTGDTAHRSMHLQLHGRSHSTQSAPHSISVTYQQCLAYFYAFTTLLLGVRDPLGSRLSRAGTAV